MINLPSRTKAAALAAALVVGGVAGTIATAAPASALNYGNCDPLLLTVVGSNESNDQDTAMTTLATAVIADAEADGKTVQWDPIIYPAVPFYKFVNPRGGKSNWLEINNSEMSGYAALKSALQTADQFCSSRSLMLAGYSQGADVVSRVVNDMSDSQKSRTSVALLGNPSFFPNLPQDDGNYNRSRRGIRPSLLQETYQILSPTVTRRTVDECLLNDPICNFNIPNFMTLVSSRNAHYKYVASGKALTAAHHLWKFAKTTLAFETPTPGSVSANGLSLSRVTTELPWFDTHQVKVSVWMTNTTGKSASAWVNLGCKDASTGYFYYSQFSFFPSSDGTQPSFAAFFQPINQSTWSSPAICWVYGAGITTSSAPIGDLVRSATPSTDTTVYGRPFEDAAGIDLGPALWDTTVNVG